jgi:hypothetical protein
MSDYILANAALEIRFGDDGQVLSFTDKRHNWRYGGGDLWRIIYKRGICLENHARCSYERPRIERIDKQRLRLSYQGLAGSDGPLAASLSILAVLHEDHLAWSIELENNDPAALIREYHFPLLGDCQLPEAARLIRSANGGQVNNDVKASIRACHTQYMASDERFIQMDNLYPGRSASNCYIFDCGQHGLYVGSHDLSFQNTLHLFRLSGDCLEVGMVKYPYINAGEKVSCDGFIWKPYTGSWHVGADFYRAWADSWFKPQPRPAQVEEMRGWQRIIMRHQYGETLYRYDEMENILQDGLAAGIDTLLMFGWHQAGHDAGYPEYLADPEQGGQKGLRENVRRFQAGGGKVLFYFNGQLIDMDSAYYRGPGRRISVKNENGVEHQEWYKFGSIGTALRTYGNKSFVTACPYCEEWLELLKGLADLAMDLGADGVFFDQLGYISQPCYDPEHGHRVPMMDPMAAKSRMVKALREHINKRDPKTSLGIEWFSDVTSQHVDYIHNITGGCNPNSFQEWSRYVYPEIILSDREIRDDFCGVERRLNHALLLGMISDVEIFRCRKTVASAPNYAAWLKLANGLRERQGDFLLRGRYRDTLGFTLDNAQILARSFLAQDGRMAVLATQSECDEAQGNVEVPGFRYEGCDGYGEYEVVNADDQAKICLKRHGLALLLYRKK